MDDQDVQQPVADAAYEENYEEPTLTTEEQSQDVPQPEGQPIDEVQAPEGEEPVEEVVTQDEVQEDEEEEYIPYEPTVPTGMPTPQFDMSQVPVDEDGNIDPNALAQAFTQHTQQAVQAATQSAAGMVRELEERRVEEAQWNKAREKFPELKSDKTLAQEVQALRYGMFMQDLNTGKENARLLSPAQAMERLNKRLGSYKTAGVKQATENVRVQESVYVEPTSNSKSTASSDEETHFRQMRSPNRAEAEAAQAAILRNRLFGDN